MLQSSTRLLVILIMFLPIIGCGVSDGKVTVRDVLKTNSEADIIKYNDSVYSNVTNSEWFQDHKNLYKKGEEVGEVRKQSTNSFTFSNFTASKLPKGTKIYSANESGLLIVEIEKEILYYIELIGG